MCACRRAHGLTRKGHTGALFASSCVCSPRGLVSVTRPRPSPWSARPLKGDAWRAGWATRGGAPAPEHSSRAAARAYQAQGGNMVAGGWVGCWGGLHGARGKAICESQINQTYGFG